MLALLIAAALNLPNGHAVGWTHHHTLPAGCAWTRTYGIICLVPPTHHYKNF